MSARRTIAALAAGLWLGACTTTTTTTRGVDLQTPDRRDRGANSEADDTARRAQVRLELASAYYSRGQMDVALDEVKLAIAADPNLSQAHNLRGLIYANLGDERQAEESFRRALQVNARDGDAMQNFGWYLCQRKRFPEAQSLFDQALAIPAYREAARTLLAKGVCLALDKQYGEAERVLSRSLQLEPSNPSTAVNLAEVLYRLGQYERARAMIARVNAISGVVNAQTLWLAARIERQLGNQRAVDEFGARMRSQFPNAPETDAFQKGRFSD